MKTLSSPSSQQTTTNNPQTRGRRGVSFLQRNLNRVAGATKTFFALVGVGTFLYAYREYRAVTATTATETTTTTTTNTTASNENKKKILVIPFHRIKLVETPKRSLRSAFMDSINNNGIYDNDDDDDDDDDSIMEIPVNQLVDTIHTAAQDDSIVALYGIFGHSSPLPQSGMAHIEQLRQALQVFKESHRIHKEIRSTTTETTTTNTETTTTTNNNDPNNNNNKKTPKYLYAYADTLASPSSDNSSNKQYYLASVFTHLHLQQHGELTLDGTATRNTFWKQFLQQNGIKIHVFKHGSYKNAPNTFTESAFTKQHKENVQTILHGIEQHTQQQIIHSRFRHIAPTTTNKHNNNNSSGVHDGTIWKLLKQHGTLIASEAKAMGLVDYTPLLCPLQTLIKHNNNNNNNNNSENQDSTPTGTTTTNNNTKQPWHDGTTDFTKFQAQESISLQKYQKHLAKLKSIQNKQWKWHQRFQKMADSSSATQSLLSLMGYNAPNFNIPKQIYNQNKQKHQQLNKQKHKIAVLHITGAINDTLALKTVRSLRKIRNDHSIKCVILRVDSPGGSVTASETILQETKAMPQPVICSMANVAASGGYYIATGCQKIFAMPTTITGSIGVFGIKLDMTALAKKYGITSSKVSTGPHAGAHDILQPMTKQISNNFSKNIDRYYDYFKHIVATSRGFDTQQVEALAQGRVWTGEQAKMSGLVDELGGLHRAIAYAKRNYAIPEEAIVETWPKQLSPMERLKKILRSVSKSDTNLGTAAVQLCHLLVESIIVVPGTSGIQYDDDDNDNDITKNNPLVQLKQLLQTEHDAITLARDASSVSAVSLSMDENLALSLFLQEIRNKRV